MSDNVTGVSIGPVICGNVSSRAPTYVIKIHDFFCTMTPENRDLFHHSMST